MGKFFVTVSNRSNQYRVCRDDIQTVFSSKIKKLPKLPHYHHQKTTDDDALTIDQDYELEFEPIQFFPTVSQDTNWTTGNPHGHPEVFSVAWKDNRGVDSLFYFSFILLFLRMQALIKVE